MQIDHVVLWVSDPERALTFYTTVVGLEGVRAEEFLAGSAPFPSVRVSAQSILDLMPSMAAPFAARFTGETIPTAAGRPLNHICLAMAGSEFGALSARLAGASIAMHRIGETSFGALGPSKHWFYFQDSDGNVIGSAPLRVSGLPNAISPLVASAAYFFAGFFFAVFFVAFFFAVFAIFQSPSGACSSHARKERVAAEVCLDSRVWRADPSKSPTVEPLALPHGHAGGSGDSNRRTGASADAAFSQLDFPLRRTSCPDVADGRSEHILRREKKLTWSSECGTRSGVRPCGAMCRRLPAPTPACPHSGMSTSAPNSSRHSSRRSRARPCATWSATRAVERHGR